MEYVILWVFKILIIFSVFMVVHSSNPIHSVLFLILVFCNSAGIVLMLQAEFLAMVFVVVYVGAIAVLFLFVVMMLNIKSVELNYSVLSYLPIGGLIVVLLTVQISLLLYKNLSNVTNDDFSYNLWVEYYNSITNMEVIGQLLYTYYFDLFLMCGMILLVAMIGAIVLTLTHRNQAKRQNIFDQISRNPQDVIMLKQI
jgi:NADH-quinone oxidoreductase subunit J